MDDALREQIAAYLDGELDEAEREQLESRLDSDPEAREELEAMQAVDELYQRLPRQQAPVGFEDRVRNALLREGVAASPPVETQRNSTEAAAPAAEAVSAEKAGNHLNGRRHGRRALWSLLTAAAVVLTLGAAGLLYLELLPGAGFDLAREDSAGIAGAPEARSTLAQDEALEMEDAKDAETQEELATYFSLQDADAERNAPVTGQELDGGASRPVRGMGGFGGGAGGPIEVQAEAAEPRSDRQAEVARLDEGQADADALEDAGGVAAGLRAASEATAGEDASAAEWAASQRGVAANRPMEAPAEPAPSPQMEHASDSLPEQQERRRAQPALERGAADAEGRARQKRNETEVQAPEELEALRVEEQGPAAAPPAAPAPEAAPLPEPPAAAPEGGETMAMEAPAVVVEGAAAAEDADAAAREQRRAAGRTFTLRAGQWVEEGYAGQRTQVLRAGSRSFRAVADDVPGLESLAQWDRPVVLKAGATWFRITH